MNKKFATGIISRAINQWMLEVGAEAFLPKENDITKTANGYYYKMNIVKLNNEYYYGRQEYQATLRFSEVDITLSIFHFAQDGKLVRDFDRTLI